MLVLPNVLLPGLDVVFCGTAVGNRSAAVRAYYAGRGNRFWRILFEIGLTPRLFAPEEYALLLTYGLGLTDLATEKSGRDRGLAAGDFDAERFLVKIGEVAPRAVAFNGKRAATSVLGRRVDYGRQATTLGRSTLIRLALDIRRSAALQEHVLLG